MIVYDDYGYYIPAHALFTGYRRFSANITRFSIFEGHCATFQHRHAFLFHSLQRSIPNIRTKAAKFLTCLIIWAESHYWKAHYRTLFTTSASHSMKTVLLSSYYSFVINMLEYCYMVIVCSTYMATGPSHATYHLHRARSIPPMTILFTVAQITYHIIIFAIPLFSYDFDIKYAIS